MKNTRRYRKFPGLPTTLVSMAFLGLLVLALIFGAIAGGQNGGFPQGTELEVTAIQFSEDDPEEDAELTISVTLVNTGATEVQNITIRLLINGEIEGKTPGLTLAGGESVTRDFEWTAESGGHNVTAYALVNGITVSGSVRSEVLSVNVGDMATPLYALFVIAIMVVVMAVLPSVANAIRK